VLSNADLLSIMPLKVVKISQYSMQLKLIIIITINNKRGGSLLFGPPCRECGMMVTMMQAAQAELLSCQTQLDQLSTECMDVCPIYARQATTTNTTTPPCAVLALCDYSNNQVVTRCYHCWQ